MVLRAALIVAGLAAFIGEAAAQYYPPGPYRLSPPEDLQDEPDIYTAPPRTGPYQRPAAPYPYEVEQPPYDPSRADRQALPTPAPGTNFPPPASYPWVRERGYATTRDPSVIPYEDRSPPPAYGRIPNRGWEPIRPPGEIETGAIGSARGPNTVGPNAAPTIASLPPDYQPEQGEAKELPPHLRRQLVDYPTREPAGTIVIDTPNTYLYLVLGNGKAMRYGIGVGREGFTWSGTERISKTAEWPDWHPPAEMIERQPYLPRFMAGGESNPLGARALYLGKTLYRIHGTNQPSTIGSFVSSGCIRLINDDVIDLNNRVQVGTRVVVLPGKPPASVPSTASVSRR